MGYADCDPIFQDEAGNYSGFNENISSMQEEGFSIFWAGDSVETMSLTNSVYQTKPLFNTALAYIRRKGEYVTKYDEHVFAVSSDLEHVGKLLLETNSKSKIIYFDSAKDCMEAVLTKKVEMAQLQTQMQQREEIFHIVSEHSNRIFYTYDLKTRTTKPWDQENAQKDILAHVYSGIYSEENLDKNNTIFTERKDAVKNFFSNIHSGVPSGEVNVRIKLKSGEFRWYHFKYSSIFHLDHVEKIIGIPKFEYTQEQNYTFSQLLDEIFSHNIEFVKKEAALSYFSTEHFLASYTRGKRELHSEWQIRYPLGTVHWFNTAITLIEDPYNRDIKLFLWMQDITEKR